MIVAVRSSGRTSFREPLKARPIGERVAETITDSGITAPVAYEKCAGLSGKLPVRTGGVTVLGV
jgi:hypothetical protein